MAPDLTFIALWKKGKQSIRKRYYFTADNKLDKSAKTAVISGNAVKGQTHDIQQRYQMVPY